MKHLLEVTTMKFSIYQIRFEAADVLAINSDQPNAKYSAKNKMAFDFDGHKIGGFAAEAMEAGLFDLVAHIEAEDYNQCFEIGNIGPEQNITRLDRMSSLSVGDVIVGEDGTVAVVASMGFVAFSFNPKMAA